MNYIVFDLEWNQCPTGKQDENKRLPFEIIEIGAVKLGGKKEYIDSFRALIRPKVYRQLHFQTRKVIGIRMEQLIREGIPFPEAAEKFLKWCGEDIRFCTWGTQDLLELQQNLDFYGSLDLLPGPIIYEDVQKLFAITYETRKIRRALGYAVEYLDLPEDGAFHVAKEDAAYTARILQKIPDEIIQKDYSIDVWQNPKSREEEIRLHYDTYEKYVTREFESRDALLEAPEAVAVRCFICGRNAKRVIPLFADGGRRYTAVGCCREHGYVKIKLRVREAADGCFYGIKTTRMVTDTEVAAVNARRAFHRTKRHESQKNSND